MGREMRRLQTRAIDLIDWETQNLAPVGNLIHKALSRLF